jgi:hypothetical protein
MLTDWALPTSQLRVLLWPASMVAGVAVKLRTTGPLAGVTVTVTSWLTSAPALPATTSL